MTAPNAAPRHAKGQAGRAGQRLLAWCSVALLTLGAVGFVFAHMARNPEASTGGFITGDALTQADNPHPSLKDARLDVATPEGQLIRAYQHLARGEEGAAFATVESLVRAHPDFSLAQLLYADLLQARAGAPTPLMAASDASLSAEEARSVAQLRAEARLRLAALVERPPQNALPREFASLSPAIKHAIAVDTSRARLYVFENSASGPKLLRDLYVSIGKLGTGKQVEGDMRTPLGIYHVGLRRDDAVDRYGAAALPLNYPNEYDRQVGRSGSNIWIHGNSDGRFSRGPLASDGCVVLAFEDMQALARLVEPRETPVLIQEHLHWIKHGVPDVAALDGGFERAYQRWERARLTQDAQTVATFYEPGLERGSDSEAERLARNLERMNRHEWPVRSLQRISALPWTEKQKVVIVTYLEADEKEGHAKLKRQYWREHDGRWTIMFDGLVG
ncbi:MAG: L,D-transpeptidase family protein [Burkholderiaceae bacterium]|nr:L,D-transpeptidase family protein [Roseateles sp.]MBV8468921.1 L,D-transpeptidase family protein [Burkholderiaceae bacterium]